MESYEIIDIEEKQSPGFDSYTTTGENEGINERIQRNVDQKQLSSTTFLPSLQTPHHPPHTKRKSRVSE